MLKLQEMLRAARPPWLSKPWVRDLDDLAVRACRRLLQDGAQDLAPGVMIPSRLDPSFFTSGPWQAFAAKYGTRDKEIVREPLYSMKTYATGGHTQLTFFDQNFGAATNTGFSDTNMQQANQMPAGEGFLITNIRFLTLPSQTDYDAANTATPVAFGQWLEVTIRNCWLELWILGKPYFRMGPLALFPMGIGPGSVVAGAATVLRNVSWSQSGNPDTTALFVTDPPVFLNPLDNFYAQARWATALAVTTAGKAGVMADGLHVRNIQ